MTRANRDICEALTLFWLSVWFYLRRIGWPPKL